VLVTGLLAAILVENGAFSPEMPVADVLAEFDSEDKRPITIGQLLTHTSRLPAWKPLYLCVSDPADITAEIGRTPLDTGEKRVIYSDLNFITLGKIVERLTGMPLEKAATEMIFSPLRLNDTLFNPPASFRSRIAASEKGNEYERQTCVDLGYVQPPATIDGSDGFRTGTIWGQVHDGNAFFMGGASGHAGLFSTAGEVLDIARQFLPGHSSLLKQTTCLLFQTNLTPGRNEHRSFAFQLASTPDSAAGTQMSPESFGHLGFTGTSLWVDPIKDRVFILLTNRTHHHELPFVIINSVRRWFHDLAADQLDGNS
jgi:serine-type D-Ala-D-Ala carboxypeptidase